MRIHYFCVLDFESTCDDTTDIKEFREIIEFPSVLYKINKKKGKYELALVSEFHEYVRPVILPKLSEFCTNLTGITQDVVDGADVFENVYQRHYDWLKTCTGDVDSVCFVTCGHWDLAVALPKEIADKHITNYYPVYKRYINIKKEFETWYNTKTGSMVSMLSKLKLPLDGRHHSGIDDTRNIAKILIKMCEDDYTVARAITL